MIGLVQAELLKLRTIRTPFILLAVAVGIALLAGGIQVAVIEYQSGPPTLTAENMAFLISGSAAAILLALVIGAVGATGELRHRTEYLNHLVSPRRWPQILARVVAYLIFGLAFAAVVIVTVAGSAAAWAAIRVGEVPWGPDATRIVLGVVMVSAAYMVIGLAVGTMIGNQAAAVVIIILWPLFLEPILTIPFLIFNPNLSALLPFNAAQALLIGNQEEFSPGFGPWTAAATVLGWTAILTAAGIWLSLRREAK